MTINVELLRKTLEDITAHPEEWNQLSWAVLLLPGEDGLPLSALESLDRWKGGEAQNFTEGTACGTACCLAGNVATKQLGGKLVFEPSKQQADHVKLNGRTQEIREVAREALGLSEDQADTLFSPFNTLRDLWRWAGEFTDGEIEIPLSIQFQ